MDCLRNEFRRNRWRQLYLTEVPPGAIVQPKCSELGYPLLRRRPQCISTNRKKSSLWARTEAGWFYQEQALSEKEQEVREPHIFFLLNRFTDIGAFLTTGGRSIKKREDSCSVMCGNPLVSWSISLSGACRRLILNWYRCDTWLLSPLFYGCGNPQRLDGTNLDQPRASFDQRIFHCSLPVRHLLGDAAYSASFP